MDFICSMKYRFEEPHDTKATLHVLWGRSRSIGTWQPVALGLNGVFEVCLVLSKGLRGGALLCHVAALLFQWSSRVRYARLPAFN